MIQAKLEARTESNEKCFRPVSTRLSLVGMSVGKGVYLMRQCVDQHAGRLRACSGTRVGLKESNSHKDPPCLKHS